ncbi:energy-coupling factor transporter transmembrane component T family protein [Paraoerskovia marina]|uniref:energy-coupling factor transporter transmembrane component T family protein n=1 Tax=Paraoerskovia marina TaxID=545619 RepID=UPI000492A6FC|nr:energy-coupling factor transporter transmembrane component T [Paraoerskovia marina]
MTRGPSALHRLPAGAKLAALAAGSLGLILVDSLPGVLAALGLVAAGYAAARISPRLAWEQVRPVALLVAILFGAQIWMIGLEPAAVVALRVVVLVALAGLVTLTTRAGDLLATIERAAHPLRGVGVDPARMALVLSLAIRGIPVLADVSRRVQDAQRARGRRDVRAYAVPVVVGALRRADAVSEALAARGRAD